MYISENPLTTLSFLLELSLALARGRRINLAKPFLVALTRTVSCKYDTIPDTGTTLEPTKFIKSFACCSLLSYLEHYIEMVNWKVFLLFSFLWFCIIPSFGWRSCASKRGQSLPFLIQHMMYHFREPYVVASRRKLFLSRQDESIGDPGGGVITDWVVQNLEDSNSRITSRSSVKAGENDTLPENGLVIGNLRILASDTKHTCINDVSSNTIPIRLLVGRNGWGTGVHPSTHLCLEWICQTIRGDETVLDYGCGSGILSIAALRLGAQKCYGVDIEAEALVTAVRNVEMNLVDSSITDVGHLFEPIHTREVLPYGIHSPTGVDICVANILIGQLLRPSMIVALVSNLATDGLLCLSGIRPGDQVDSLKTAYGPHVAWIEEHYAELAASDTPSSIDSYGFDCGVWCRLVGRKIPTLPRSDEIAAMSESAVS